MKKIAASLMFAATLSAAVAQTNTTRSLSLSDCIREALQHNFDVRVEQYNPQISLFDLHAAYAGYDPVFTLSGTHSYNKSGVDGFPYSVTKDNALQSGLAGALPSGMTYDFSGSVNKGYGFSSLSNFNNGSSGQIGVTATQPLLRNFWTDNTRMTISVAKNRLKYSEQGLRSQLITTVTAVENAYYELIFARENVKVEQEALELAQTQLDQDKERVEIKVLAERGGTLEQDEAQVAQSHANLIAAQFTLVSDQNALKNLITDAYAQWHDVDIEPAASMDAVRQFFDLQDSWSKGLTQRPDFVQAKLDVEQQGIVLKFSFNQIFPELDLVGSYGFNGAGQDFNGSYNQFGEVNRPFYSYGAQLSMPLGNLSARNNYKAGKATEQQLLLRLKQLEQNIMVEIDDAVQQAQSAWDSLDATKQARVYAEAALEAEQKKYDVGKSTTFTVLQLQTALTTARSNEIRALANYNEALSNLAEQEGSTLERQNLDLQVK
jgi:outer membrane protein TolC